MMNDRLAMHRRVLVDCIVSIPAEAMRNSTAAKIPAMAAHYVGIEAEGVEAAAVEAVGGATRVRLALPLAAGKALIAGYLAKDPRMAACFREVPGELARVEAARAEVPAGRPDTSEAGLETLIVRGLTAFGWTEGSAEKYDREFAVDLEQLTTFLTVTQPKVAAAVGLEEDSAERRKFLAQVRSEVWRRGVIDVLRNGVKHGKHDITAFYASASPGNVKAAELQAKNRFSVTRQLRYSRDEKKLALDLCLFVNGLPVATFELKNNLTKQTVDDAVEQFRRDRDARETLFQFGRCVVHFAMDEQRVKMCTELKDKASWFLPFDQGWRDGAGNPPNPYGIATDYLWKRILTPGGLTEILENYAQIVEEKD